MKWSELVRKIEDAGWQVQRTTSGSHRVYRHAAYDYPLVIAYHKNKEVPPGLMHSLLRKAGLK